jgi:chromosome segregation ATPase
MTPAPTARPRLALGRTARPLPGRPVKIDLSGLARAARGEELGESDHIGPLGSWSADVDEFARGTDGLPLRDVVDRAAAQLLVLRKAVEEAAIADRVVRQHKGELEKRLVQGERFAAELDQRLVRAGKAAEVVEKAASALAAMEAVVSQLRAGQDAVARVFESRLEQQQKTMEARLAARQDAMEAQFAHQQQTFETRMAAQRELFEKRIADLSATFEQGITAARKDAAAIREEFERTLGEHRKSIMGQTEQLCATADRHVAQTQARASLILDAASDRIDVLHKEAGRLGQRPGAKSK